MKTNKDVEVGRPHEEPIFTSADHLMMGFYLLIGLIWLAVEFFTKSASK